MIHLFETSGGEGSSVPPLHHSTGVVELALNQSGPASDRLLAFVDRNRDLYIATVVLRGTINRKIEKLG